MNQGARYDLTIAQGSYFELPLTWKDSDGNLVNNTGFAFTFQATNDDGSLAINLSNNMGITLGGASGTILIEIPDETTATYTFDQVPYNIEYTPPNGKKKRFMYGFITVSKDVST